MLQALLTSWGHQVKGWDFRDNRVGESAEVNIFLETLVPGAFSKARVNIYVPNVEWVLPTYMQHVAKMDLVLCKTQDALRIMARHSPRCVHTGFISEDHQMAGVGKVKTFFHLGGGSTVRGTQTILDTWRRFNIQEELTVVSSVVKDPKIRGVRVMKNLSAGELIREQNRNLFHLTPSEYEGFGMGLWESLSCGAVVITTDHPPMNEFLGCAGFLPPDSFGQQRLAQTAKVAPESIADAVLWCNSLAEAEIDAISKRARTAWEQMKVTFEANLKHVFDKTTTDLLTGGFNHGRVTRCAEKGLTEKRGASPSRRSPVTHSLRDPKIYRAAKVSGGHA